MSNIIQLPLSDGSFLDVNTDSGAIVRSSSSRVGQPRVITQTVADPNVLPAAAVVAAVLNANANNLAANTVDCTSPCLAQTLDGQLAFLPEDADDRGETQGWLILSTTAIGDAHEGNQGNPHLVTKAQVGLANVDDTSDADKPISTLTQAALDDKALTSSLGTAAVADTSDFATAAVGTASTAHIADLANPHAVTATQVGLPNVDDTSDADKPVSTATQTALNAKADQTALDAHAADAANPHVVTKAQVGLPDADNTADADKPISTLTQAALNAKLDTVDGVKEGAALDANADNLDGNTTLVVGPAFSLTQDGYVAFLPAGGASGGVNHDWEVLGNATNIDAHIADITTNPHAVTKADVLLGNVDNTADADKPISTATQAALDDKALTTNLGTAAAADTGDFATAAVGAASTAHIADLANPHTVTATQVGLGNVSNTADADKPISTLTQAALNDKLDTVDGVKEGATLNANADNLDGNTIPVVGPAFSLTQDGYVAFLPAGGAFGGVNHDWEVLGNATNIDAHIADITGNPHQVTKADVLLGNVDNTADTDKPISTLTQAALDDKALTTNLGTAAALDTSDFSTAAVGAASTAHIADVANPHAVTATQVGLGNVSNTADADKLISTLTQAALDDKLDTVDGVKEGATLNANADNLDGNTIPVVGPAFSLTQDGQMAFLPAGGASGGVNHDWELLGNATDLDAHIADITGNPHAVTKADVGLGNVDNTSDALKPISDATQVALNDKANQTALVAHQADVANPHVVTATQVGLGNVDNTSDALKQISDATQAALDAKQAIIGDDVVTGVATLNAAADNLGANTVIATGPAMAITQDFYVAYLPKNGAYQGVNHGWKVLASLSSLTVHLAHLADITGNPHQVTKANVGLANVDNTSDADKVATGPIHDAISTGIGVVHPGMFSEVGLGAVLTELTGADNSNGGINPNAGGQAFIVGSDNYGNTGEGTLLSGKKNQFHSGDFGAVFGQENTSNSGNYTLISGNLISSNTGEYSLIAGQNHTGCNGNYNVIVGNTNTVAASLCAVFGGSHQVNSSYCLIAGDSHIINATGTFATGYAHEATTDAEYGSIMGIEGKGSLEAATVISGGKFQNIGDAQAVSLVTRATTTSATPVELKTDSNLRATLIEDGAWAFDIEVVAADRAMFNTKRFKRSGLIMRKDRVVVGDFTVDTATDVIALTGHGLSVNDAVRFTTSTNNKNNLPAGLDGGNFFQGSPEYTTVDYYVLTAPDANTITVSLTQGGAVVDITDSGTGTHSLLKRQGSLVISAIETVGTDLEIGAALTSTSVAITADEINSSLKIAATGVAATDIHWVASIKLTSVSFPNWGC